MAHLARCSLLETFHSGQYRQRARNRTKIMQARRTHAHDAHYPFIPVQRSRLSFHAQLQILGQIHLLPETKYVENEALLLVRVRSAS